MKLLPLFALLLAGCVSESTARANYAKLSDSDLMTAHATASQPGAVLMVPQARHRIADEMKRRGLIGPGRDGIPAKEGQF
jgi:uncharacterized lipoprotein YmbA